MTNYFGPLSKEYCLYFYILSILSFIFFVVGLFSFVVIIIKKYKSLESTFYMNNIFTLFNILIIYFVNRLLHTMCIVSVH
jgi:hypothetical protein